MSRVWAMALVAGMMVLAQCAFAGVPPRVYHISGPDGLERLKTLSLAAGDTVYLHGNFSGTLTLKAGVRGALRRPIDIMGGAVIMGGNRTAVALYKTSYIVLGHLRLSGAGRKEGNTESGLVINTCQHISADSLIVEGFQKAGVYVYASSDITISRVFARDNGYAGISIEGAYGTRNCSAIRIKGCRAENNPGDPTNLTNHSGNGIVAGYCRNVMIENSVATNNGWDMPRVGNGPVGIWAYESDSVLISRCISFRNKTAKGADDGGGFDLDGGVTHSVIQYSLSYENAGSGFGLFQYAGASRWHHNSVHDCVSNNDGLVSAARAGVFIWNSSRDAEQLTDLSFYNNVVYNTKGAAINYAVEGEHKRFRFYNNAFVTADSVIIGHRDTTDVFVNNHFSGL